jgi:hypothetical protein
MISMAMMTRQGESQLWRSASRCWSGRCSYGIPVPVAYEGEPTDMLVSPAVRRLTLEGNKLAAIKALVQETGMGPQGGQGHVERL